MERRVGTSAIPSDPRSYLNEQQQLGLIQLREFGWTTFCVRRSTQADTTTILRNRYNRILGILNEDGTLRLAKDLKVRDSRSEEASDIDEIVATIRQRVDTPPQK